MFLFLGSAVKCQIFGTRTIAYSIALILLRNKLWYWSLLLLFCANISYKCRTVTEMRKCQYNFQCSVLMSKWNSGLGYNPEHWSSPYAAIIYPLTPSFPGHWCFSPWFLYSYLYSITSLIGVLMLLVLTPLGLARTFTVIGELVMKPQVIYCLETL